MISLECSNCKTVLSIDDAFAGGVCRCQHCGTIQTVPKIGQRPSSPMEDPGTTASKALFKRKGRIESALNPYNDQLAKAADEISPSEMNRAAVVGPVGRRPAGSGDSGIPSPGGSYAGPSPSAAGRAGSGAHNATTSRVATAPSAPPAAAPAAAPSAATPAQVAAHNPIRPSAAAQAPEIHDLPGQPGKKKMLLIGMWILILLLVAGVTVYVIFFSRGGSTDTTTTKNETTASNNKGVTPPDLAGVPSICGITLRGKTIVYIVDRAGCTSNGFQKMLAACYTSIESLTPSRKFQLIVWNNHRDLAYPVDKAVNVSATNLAACQKATADTYAGAGDLIAALRKAPTAKADEIVLMSAVEVDEPTARDIRTALDQKSVKFHGIAVGLDLTGDALKTLTNQFNGSFRKEDLSQLK